MRKHLGRTLLIIATLVITAITLYPTLGWYRVDEAEQQRRIERWRQEEMDQRREGAGVFQRGAHAVKKWSQFDRDMVINLGLDLQGGVLMVLGFDMTEDMKARNLDEKDVQLLVLNNIRNRIEEFEAKEPVIQALGTNQIQIQLPGQKDIQRAKDLITRTAHLGFHIVSGPDETDQLYGKIDKYMKNGFVPFLQDRKRRGEPIEVEEANYPLIRKAVDEALKVPDLIPADKTIAFGPAPKSGEGTRRMVYVMDRVERLSGEGLSSASPATDQRHPGNWMILFEFTGEASTKFADLTGDNVDRQMAIVVDGNVMSAPTIQQRISGSGNITGSFTADEAKDLSIALNSGSLPVSVREEYAAIVGASIGAEAVRAGVLSSIASLAVVAIFMILWYRLAGVVAVISLTLNAIMILASFAYFDITLTLPGIAGMVLTIGMAVDSNVLIYERIREELSHGKTLSNAIQAGFQHAASAILDSNITTIIAALVLMQFGTGAIQGFAVALSIGVVSTLFGALIVSRAIMEFIDENKLASKLSMANVIPLQPNIDFMGKRRIALGFSVLIIAAGAVTFVMRGRENYGVDFNTGTNAQLQIVSASSISDGDVRARLVSAGFAEPVVQRFQEAGTAATNSFLIRVGEAEQTGSEPVARRMQNALAPLSGGAAGGDVAEQVKIERLETVGPSVGAQLRYDALSAVFFSLLLIVIYLWFRFEWRFALGAVIATFHDVLVVVGVFAMLGEKITIPVIAALLTIIGYSLNDTIVVFDRVREDMVVNRSKGLTFLQGLNLSLNRTLSRTLLTSLLTLFVVVVLYFTGGASLQPFSLAMILGIVIGTYSSIYIASPVVLYWEVWREKVQARRAKPEKSPRKRKGPAPSA
jgi:SecD/SecF fusion protein